MDLFGGCECQVMFYPLFSLLIFSLGLILILRESEQCWRVMSSMSLALMRKCSRTLCSVSGSRWLPHVLVQMEDFRRQSGDMPEELGVSCRQVIHVVYNLHR